MERIESTDGRELIELVKVVDKSLNETLKEV